MKNKTLTRAEDAIMQALWNIDKGFVKDIIEQMPEPKPHYNTVNTILKIMVEKGFVGVKSFGKSNEYFALVKKEDYSNSSLKQLVKKHFNGSFESMLSFFVKENDISLSELENILENIKKQQS